MWPSFLLLKKRDPEIHGRRMGDGEMVGAFTAICGAHQGHDDGYLYYMENWTTSLQTAAYLAARAPVPVPVPLLRTQNLLGRTRNPSKQSGWQASPWQASTAMPSPPAQMGSQSTVCQCPAHLFRGGCEQTLRATRGYLLSAGVNASSGH